MKIAIFAKLPMPTLLAWRNLVYDRSRLYVAVIGIGFSVLLMNVQISLLLGFAQTAAGLVDHAGADLWVCGRGIKNIDESPIIPSAWRYTVLAVPGITAARAYLVRFTNMRAPDGHTESVVVVGYDQATVLGNPWNVVTAAAARLPRDGVLVDRLYAAKLHIDEVGQRVEVGGIHAHIAGLTRGIRTFVQSPYVFAGLDEAQAMAGVGGDQASCILATMASGSDQAAVITMVRRRLPYADSYLTADFARRTIGYWLFSTGVGFYLLLGFAMGLIVGAVIAAQTLYAGASDYLPEYATMRAIGATDSYLRSVVLQQAVISAVLGWIAGISASVMVVAVMGDGEVALSLPLWVAVALLAATVATCMLAGLVAISRVLRVQPTSIFR